MKLDNQTRREFAALAAGAALTLAEAADAQTLSSQTRWTSRTELLSGWGRTRRARARHRGQWQADVRRVLTPAQVKHPYPIV